jgi:hypothetical protein
MSVTAHRTSVSELQIPATYAPCAGVPWQPAQRWKLCDIPSCDEDVIVMVYSEGETAASNPSAKASATVVPGEIYAIKVEILRNDLGSASERVTDIRIDGVSVGDCNPDGGDYDCTFFDCSSTLTTHIATAKTYGMMDIEIDVVGHSYDCDWCAELASRTLDEQICGQSAPHALGTPCQ